MSAIRYRSDIDGLRAIAVLSVVFFHASLGFPGGYIGVDVFFVLSGFLITKIIYSEAGEGTFSFVHFYDRRIRRLFPALFAMLFVVSAWAIYRMIFIDLVEYGRSLGFASVYLSNLEFYQTTKYFNPVAETRPLLHTWSLAVEEQFYIVAPTAILILSRFIPKRWHVLAVILAVCASYAFCIWQTGDNPRAAFYLPVARAWELGLGAVVAIASPAIARAVTTRSYLRQGLSAIGMVMIVAPMFVLTGETPFPGWVAVVPTLGTAFVLCAGLSGGKSFVADAISVSPMTFIGKISYSLYLWHWPILVGAKYGLNRDLRLAEILLCLAASFLAAWLSYRYVETPIRKGALLKSTRSLFLAAGAATAVAVATAAAIVTSDGFPARQPEVKSELASFEEKEDRCGVSTVQMIRQDRSCVRGAENAEPSFVLIGDSHGAAIAPGIFAAAKAEGVAGWQLTSPGYIPLPGRHLLGAEADTARDKAFFDFLDRHPEVRTIIVTGFWEHAASGASYRHEPEVFVDDRYNGEGTQYNQIAFRRALESLLARFPDRKFVFLDDIPTGREMDARTYWRAITGGSKVERGLPAETARAQRRAYEPILAQVARSHANAAYRPILKSLCDDRVCDIITQDGHLRYEDGDHLSDPGALALTDQLREVFREQGR